MRDRKKRRFSVGGRGHICCGIRICEGQLLCEYSAFMGNSMGSNRFLRLREYFYYKKPEHQAEYEEKRNGGAHQSDG